MNRLGARLESIVLAACCLLNRGWPSAIVNSAPPQLPSLCPLPRPRPSDKLPTCHRDHVSQMAGCKRDWWRPGRAYYLTHARRIRTMGQRTARRRHTLPAPIVDQPTSCNASRTRVAAVSRTLPSRKLQRIDPHANHCLALRDAPPRVRAD